MYTTSYTNAGNGILFNSVPAYVVKTFLCLKTLTDLMSLALVYVGSLLHLHVAFGMFELKQYSFTFICLYDNANNHLRFVKYLYNLQYQLLISLPLAIYQMLYSSLGVLQSQLHGYESCLVPFFIILNGITVHRRLKFVSDK